MRLLDSVDITGGDAVFCLYRLQSLKRMLCRSVTRKSLHINLLGQEGRAEGERQLLLVELIAVNPQESEFSLEDVVRPVETVGSQVRCHNPAFGSAAEM